MPRNVGSIKEPDQLNYTRKTCWSAKLIVLRPGTIWLHFILLKNFLTEMTPVWNFTESDNWINVLNFASRILAISVVNYTCRPCMGSTKKIVENIPVEISMGGRNTDFHTRGCSLPILPSFQWTILGYSWNFCAICDQLSMGFFTFLLYKSDLLLIWTFL